MAARWPGWETPERIVSGVVTVLWRTVNLTQRHVVKVTRELMCLEGMGALASASQFTFMDPACHPSYDVLMPPRLLGLCSINVHFYSEK